MTSSTGTASLFPLVLAEETVGPHKADWYCYMSSTSWSLEVSIRRCRIDGNLHLESLDELIGTMPLLERKGTLGHRSSAPIPAMEGSLEDSLGRAALAIRAQQHAAHGIDEPNGLCNVFPHLQSFEATNQIRHMETYSTLHRLHYDVTSPPPRCIRLIDLRRPLPRCGGRDVHVRHFLVPREGFSRVVLETLPRQRGAVDDLPESVRHPG